MTEKVRTKRVRVWKRDEKGPVMTFEELKAKIDTFTPEQLAQKVRWWGDERGGVVRDLGTLDEVYANVSGEGYEPLSGYDGDAEIAAGVEDGEYPTLAKGTPILQVD